MLPNIFHNKSDFGTFLSTTDQSALTTIFTNEKLSSETGKKSKYLTLAKLKPVEI